MELISVIIPAYNAEKSIDKCLRSILGGGYKNIEVIVVNDGSTDNTKKIIKSICHQDQRVKLIDKENGGVGSARNRGLKEATGDYIAWCDADDWVEDDWLINMYDYMKKFDPDMVICRSHIEGRPPHPEPDSFKIWNQDVLIEKFLEHTEFNGTLWNKLCKKTVYDNCSINENLHYWEDLDFIWRIIPKINRVVRLYKETYHFELHGDSLTASCINLARLQATDIVWGNIVNDCKQMNEVLYLKAVQKKCLWDYGELKLMFRDKYNDKERMKRIVDELKTNYDLVINEMGSLKEKIFFSVLLININLGKLVYHFKN